MLDDTVIWSSFNMESGYGGVVCRPGGLTLTARLLSFCSLTPGSTVLDVCCGTGESVKYLLSLGYNAQGIDIGAQTEDYPVSHGSAYSITYPEASMHAVLCECGFSLLEHPGTALTQFIRVLKPGGYLLMSDLYCRAALVQNASLGPIGKHLYTKEELFAMLHENSFEIIAFEDHSQSLRQWVGQIILNGGACRLQENLCGSASDIKRFKTGYYILAARLHNTV